MLSLPLLAPDPLLRHRDRLLEPAFAHRHVAPLLGVPGIEVVRAKYRPGRSLRVLFRGERGGTTLFAAARMFVEGSARDYERAAANGGALHVPELETVVRVFPNDRKLRGLGCLLGARTEPIPSAGGRVVAYAPEKSATVLWRDAEGGPVAYAKIYGPDEDMRAAAVYAWAAEHVRVPAVFGAAQRMLVLEPVAGDRLTDLAGADRVNAMWEFGAALARLHAAPPRGLPSFRRTSAHGVARAVDLIAATVPAAARAARDLAAALGRARHASYGDEVALHGDPHGKNAIWTARGVALIDLDQCARGPATADIGSFLAKLEGDAFAGRISRAVCAACRAAFLRGYATRRELPTNEQLHWAIAAALLTERAARAVTRVRVERIASLPRLLARAATLLRAGG